MPNDALMELVSRLSGKVMISSDIKASDIEKMDMESLIVNIIEQLREVRYEDNWEEGAWRR